MQVQENKISVPLILFSCIQSSSTHRIPVCCRIMYCRFHTACFTLLAFVATSQAASIAARADKLVDCLRSSLSPQGYVVVPSNIEFTNDTTRVSTFDAPTFKVVSRVSDEDDVRASVSAACFLIEECLRKLSPARSNVLKRLKPPFYSPVQNMVFT